MTPPAYRWSCLSCGAGNEPGQSTCSECGMSAIASGADIERAKGDLGDSLHGSPYKRLWRGGLELNQSFWVWWLAPILCFYFVLWLTWLNLLQHLGVPAIPVAMSFSVLLAIFAAIGVVKSAKRSGAGRLPRYMLSAVSILGTSVHFLIFCFVVFLATAFYKAGIDTHDEDRAAEKAAVPTAEFPLAGFWKVESANNFGLAISPASSGRYSISFCGPGGCFKPGTYRPDTLIIGDESYTVINNDTIKVSGKDGWTTYHRAPSRGEECTSDH